MMLTDDELVKGLWTRSCERLVKGYRLVKDIIRGLRRGTFYREVTLHTVKSKKLLITS